MRRPNRRKRPDFNPVIRPKQNTSRAPPLPGVIGNVLMFYKRFFMSRIGSFVAGRGSQVTEPRTVEPLRVSFSTSSLTLRSSLRFCTDIQFIAQLRDLEVSTVIPVGARHYLPVPLTPIRWLPVACSRYRRLLLIYPAPR